MSTVTEERTPRSASPGVGRPVRAALWVMGISGALFAAAGSAVFSWQAGLSAGIGALIAATNLYVLARVVLAIAKDTAEGGRSDDARRGTRLWVVIAVLKLAILFGGVYVLIRFGAVQPLALAVGLGTLPIGIAMSSLVRDRSAA